MSKIWLLIRFNVVGIVSAAVSAVIAIGLGIYSFAGLSLPAINNIPFPNNPLTPSSENVDSSSSPDDLNVDQTAVDRLVVEEGLDEDTAAVISQIDTQFKSNDGNYLNYEQTFSDQMAWDVQITAIPDQTYVPTDAELETAAATGNEIYDVSYSFEEIDDIPQFTLRYFVPYEAMSEELKASIQSNAGLSASAAAVGFVPSAEASSGATGAVFETIIKSLAKEGINKLGDFSNLFAALDAAVGAYKVSQSKSYFSELDQLRACAENPTNPLTKKTYQENPSEKAKAIDQINEAQSQVEQLTAARLLNLAAKTGAKFTGANFAGKLFFDSVAKWSDETLKEVSEGWIDDARKAVVECEQGAIRLKGSVQYRFSNTFRCPQNECESTQHISASGNFFLTTRGTAIIGNGTGTLYQTRSSSGGLSEFSCVASGDVEIHVQGSTAPPASISVIGGGVTEHCTSRDKDLKGGPDIVREYQNDGVGAFGCSAKDVDLVKGGTYKGEIQEYSSCELKLFPE